MTTLAHESPFHSRYELRRLTTVLVTAVGALVVPVLAATGLALPLPSVVYRLAVDVAKTTESVTLRVGGLAVGLGGDKRTAPPARIVLTPEERHESSGSADGDAGPAAGPARTVVAPRPGRGERARVRVSATATGSREASSTAPASTPSTALATTPVAAESAEDSSPEAATSPDAPTSPDTPTAPAPPTSPAAPISPARPASPAAKPTSSGDAPSTATTEPASSPGKEPDVRVAEDPVAPTTPPVPAVVEDPVKKVEETVGAVEGRVETVTGSLPAPPPLPKLP